MGVVCSSVACEEANKGTEVACSTPGFLGEDDDDELNMTRAESLKVLVPRGKKLQDLFPGSSSSSQAQNHNPLEFTEPARLNDGKIRWQIIQLRADRKTTAPTSSSSSSSSSSPVSSEHRHKLQTDASQRRDSSKEKKEGKSRDELNSGSSEGNRESGVEFAGKREEREGDLSPLPASERSPQSKAGDDTMVEEVFKRGVYLKPDSTLKELRNSFIDSNQLDSNDCTFRFLRSDVPGDFIEIDTEDKTLLSQIQHSLVLPATLYIESIDPVNTLLEVCVCGKFADLECTGCHRKGYCSHFCQKLDWLHHSNTCRVISTKRQRKKQKKSARKSSRTDSGINSRVSTGRAFTPSSVELCVCGRESGFECSGCGRQGYCSKACQLGDWSMHQLQCGGATASRGAHRAAVSRNQQLLTVKEEPEIERKHDTHA